ncbi:MAG: TraV family lipoprotein [Burkholderiales bacterium]|nr:TraV family lipoprotein [Burkholderiales bacterium]
MNRFAAMAALLALLLAGCSSMSGLSGSSSYACKAPEGVACDSVSGTYANAVQNNLPSQQGRAIDKPSVARPERMTDPPRLAPRLGNTATPPAAVGLPPTPVALRSAPRVLRLWFKPWEDADNDLYDQGYVYVQIDPGRWQVDHVQRQIREAYAPLKPPPRASGAGDTTTGANALRPVPHPGMPIPLVPAASRPSEGDVRPADARVPTLRDPSDDRDDGNE